MHPDKDAFHCHHFCEGETVFVVVIVEIFLLELKRVLEFGQKRVHFTVMQGSLLHNLSSFVKNRKVPDVSTLE